MSSSSSSSSDSDQETAPQQRNRTASSSSSAPSHRSGAGSPAPVGTPQAGSDSERSHASPERSAPRRLIASSSDEEQGGGSPKEKPKHSDVFGDGVSSDSDNEEGDRRKVQKADDDDEGNKSDAGSEGSLHGIRMYNENEDEPMEEELPPQVITSDAPKLDFSLGDELYHVRMPNFLSIETKPFDPNEYEDNDEDDLALDDEGNNRLKLKVENTIRWRKTGEGGNESIESNAKVVKWSDGTMSLYLGNEIFELTETHLLAHTHLYVRQTHGLAGKAVFQKRIKFRPASTDSKTHKKVTMNMADRTKKSGQVRFIQEIGENPDEAKKETVRKEEEAFRAAYRRERMTMPTRRGPDRNRGMSSGFIEDRGDFSDDESPARGRYGRRDAPIIGASDSDESDHDKRQEKEPETSDSDEEFRKNRQQQKKKIVTSDEDSD